MNSERLRILKRVVNRWNVDIESGRIFTINGEVTKATTKGRMVVSARIDGAKYKFFVHEVVAYLAGLDVLDKTVNHINGDKTDNRASNLECISLIDNVQHAIDNRLHNTVKLNENTAKEIRELYSNGDLNQRELSEKYNVSQSTISRIINNKFW